MHPVVTIPTVVKLLKTTNPTAGNAVQLLEDLGVLTKTSGKQQDRTFAYASYLEKLRGPALSSHSSPKAEYVLGIRHAGKVTTKRLRPSSVASQRASPPWRRAICCTNVRPNPVPTDLLATFGL
jgi:hypothetical protein